MKVDSNSYNPIGLLAGTSWPSSVPYYEQLNRKAADTFGSSHSASLLMRSISYGELRSSYANDWPKVLRLLKMYLEELSGFRELSCILICNNTLHKAYDDLVDGGLELSAPVVHIVDAVAAEAKNLRAEKVLLLGTEFTMSDGFYARRLESKGLQVSVPNESQQKKIQAVQTRIAHGDVRREFSDFFRELIEQYETAIDGVVLACTELPLVVKQPDFKLSVVNCIDAHVNQAWSMVSRS